MALSSGSWEKPSGWNELYDLIMGQYRTGQAPSFITQPIKEQGQREESLISRFFSQLPQGVASGLKTAQLKQSGAGTKRALGQAGGQYGYGLLSALQNLMQMQQYKPSTANQFLNPFLQGAGGNLADILI